MTEKETGSGPTTGLLRKAKNTVQVKAANAPGKQGALSSPQARQTIHERQVYQIELLMQNEELRRTQTELETSQARYFELYDLAPVGYLTISEKGFILEANLTAANMFGVTKNYLVEQPLNSFILPQSQDIFYMLSKQLFETGAPQDLDLMMQRHGGTPFWARVKATMGQTAEESPMYRVVLSDITERKRAEKELQQTHDELEQRVVARTEELRQSNEALRQEIAERSREREELRESEANLRRIAGQLVDVIFSTDDRGFITFASPSALEMFGWKPEEMVGKSFIEFLPESEIMSAVSQFKDTLASGQKMQNLSFVMKRKDGSVFPGEVNSSPVLKDGHIVGMGGIIRDVSERKLAEETLKESEERYRNQVEAINDVAYSVNSGGEFIYISPVVRNVLGYEPDEMIGRHVLDFVHQEDHDLFARKFLELREGIVSPDTYRMIGKDGNIKWVRTQTSPILDIGGFEGGRGVIVDITERVQADETLRRAEENFRRSLDDSPLGVRIVTEAGETLYANQTILDIYGYGSIEELITTPLMKRYTPESYAEFQIRKEKRQQGLDVQSEYTIDIIRKNEEVCHLQVFRKNILWDHGCPVKVC